MSGVLDGVRVLDFGRYVAGPYCATLLGDFGADVIRVERRGGGEDRPLTPVTEEGEGAIFLQLARNKRSLTLDPSHPDAAEIRRRLVENADVVVVNVPAKALKAMGLDYETLRAIKPDIILANISSFGPVGPWKDRVGFDSVGQGMCGSAYLSGDGDPPIRTPISWVDHATALYAAIGVMMALYARNTTGQGQQVDASLLGSALGFSTTYLVEEAVLGLNRAPIGNRSFINGPTDIFRTRDGWLVVQTVGNALFRRWVKLMDEPAWLDDPRFAEDALRGENGQVLSERMGQWCLERTTAEALERLDEVGLPAGPVLSPGQALQHPQVVGMDLFQTMPYPGLPAGAPLMKTPVALSDTPASIRTSPPTAGQHNRSILGDLGFSEDAIADFEKSQVI